MAMFDQLVNLNEKKCRLAIHDYSEAIRLRPEFSHAYHNRALVHAEAGHHQEAATDFVNAMICDSRYDDAYGDIYAQSRSVLFPELVTAHTTEAYLQRAMEVGFMIPCSGSDREGWWLTI